MSLLTIFKPKPPVSVETGWSCSVFFSSGVFRSVFSRTFNVRQQPAELKDDIKPGKSVVVSKKQRLYLD